MTQWRSQEQICQTFGNGLHDRLDRPANNGTGYGPGNLDTSWWKNRKDSTVVDIYSKFGEDGSSDAIKATNFYIRGLIHLANADTPSAREAFTNSLKLNPSDIWAKYYLSACK